MSHASGAVCAIVVTWNRKDLLRECLTALSSQSRAPDRVLVIDNASSDGTPDLVRNEFPDVELITLEQNLGGAGGFHAGMRRAFESGDDWLWVMDDDTIPTRDALRELLAAADRIAATRQPLILASTVIGPDGDLHPFNRPWPDTRRLEESLEAAEHGLIKIRYASFVSLMINRRAVADHGLPIEAFFTLLDDVEFSARVLRDGAGYMVPTSIAHHKSKATSSAATGPRFYYAIRNMLWLLRSPVFDRSDSWIRLRLALSLPRGMVRHLALHRFSPTAVGTIARGIRDGLRDEARA